MIQAQWVRIERMRDQTFYLIAVEQNNRDSEESPTYQFKVSGSTANLYTVKMDTSSTDMDRLLQCDCPDASTFAFDANVKCKHCCFVFLKVLKQDLRLLALNRINSRQLTRLKEACQTIAQSIQLSGLTNPKYQQKYLELTTEKVESKENTKKDQTDHQDKFKVTKQLEGNQDCPICFDELRVLNIKSVGSQCPTCQNIIHTDCIQKWLALGNTTCVFCRSEWHDKRSDQSSKSRTNSSRISSVPRGAYINLSGYRRYTFMGSDSEEEDEDDRESSEEENWEEDY